MEIEKVKCLIIGGGPAGYTAAIYASRASLEPVLYEGRVPGGQLTTTTVIDNFPGFAEGIDANELMSRMRGQAVRLGADVRRGEVSAVDFSSRPLRVTVDESHQIESEAVIIATGATARYLGLPSEQRFLGMAYLPARPVTDSFIAARWWPSWVAGILPVRRPAILQVCVQKCI